ncbi:unnamed protein product [Gongylonema pulchrum]|uniref:Uncharacterized protein n=1 Tax=Gongylonema pulchrum TaxID=637853 RepID=A0A183EDN7_9BILA|nr:unnamed protein product [Gongylonema pulchrum]
MFVQPRAGGEPLMLGMNALGACKKWRKEMMKIMEDQLKNPKTYFYNAQSKADKDVQTKACRTGTRSSMEKTIVSRLMKAEQRQNNERTRVRIRRWPSAHRNLPQQGRARPPYIRRRMTRKW